MPSSQPASAELEQIIRSARALGVEIDEEEALQWLAAMAAGGSEEVTVDAAAGIFGHRVVLLDFDPADLQRLRLVAALVEIPDRPDVETAIALSGSSAQSLVQTFPGDFDYFERVNIKAPTRPAACAVLADVLRAKALSAMRGPGFLLTEVRFGSYPLAAIREGHKVQAGSSIAWSPAEVATGHLDVLLADGTPQRITWADAAAEPGWCKLDWVLVDPGQPRAVKASNMLDVTWEDPEGGIYPLDGFIDPYYQEVYLDAAAIPLFSKISRQMKPDALYTYISQLEQEVRKYTRGEHPNFGKAAKRMYNVFRLTGRFELAAYIRELFDEPAALLYQVGAFLDGFVDLGASPGAIDRTTLVQQVDELIRAISTVAEGSAETDLIMSLLRIRDDISGLRALGDEWATLLLAMQEDITTIVNGHFETQLRHMPQIEAYLRQLG